MKHNHELDDMLDRALSEYRDAEPLAGMEDRILRRMAAHPERSARRWAWVLAAAAAAVVIVVGSWLGLRERPHEQTVATSVTQQPAKQAATGPAHAETPPLPSTESHRTTAAHLSSRPALSNRAPQVAKAGAMKTARKPFPTPAPMTTEEHALLALARTHPDALLAGGDDALADKLSITPIEIKPLAPESGAPQGEQQ